MINIQGAGSLKKISGVTDGKVERIKELRFARKHLTQEKEKDYIKKTKHIFAFVSSPRIYKDNYVIRYAKGWCHALRKPEKLLPNKPKAFLPESDFMDPMFVSFLPKKNYKYDFFYYTLNSKSGIKNKGLDVFCQSVSILCGKMKLRGCVVVYFPNVPRIRRLVNLNGSQMNILNSHKDRLDFFWGKMTASQMAELASQSRFGFFPNTADNSPRTIPETLLRNTPVMVNEKIHGGWHYINEQTGELFTLSNLEEKTHKILNNIYNPRDYFLANYGFERSSKKLAEFVQSVVSLKKIYTHMYFNNFEPFLEKRCAI